MREKSTDCLLGTCVKTFHIINYYSILGARVMVRTVSQTLMLFVTLLPMLIIERFNFHRPLAGPLRIPNSTKI